MRITAYRIDYAKHKRMLQIFNSCAELGIKIPQEVSDYFQDRSLHASKIEIHRCLRDMADGTSIVDIESLPDDVKTLVITED